MIRITIEGSGGLGVKDLDDMMNGDVPRMRQRSVEIGDLSVNPMWC